MQANHLPFFAEHSVPVRDWPEYAGDRDALTVFGDKLQDGWWIDYMDGDRKQAPWVQPESDARTNGMRQGPGLCVNLLAKVSTNCRSPK